MTRGRHHNLAWVLDPTGEADPTEALAAVLQRPPSSLTAHATRERLYSQQGLSVEVDTPGVLNAAERMLQLLDRLQTPTGPSREPPGLAL